MRSTLLQRAWHLGPPGWGLLFEVAATAVLVELGLRLMPLRQVLRFVGDQRAPAVRSPRLDAEEQLALVLRVASAIFRRSPIPITCLRQSLILCSLLRRREIVTRVRIGIARNGESVSAHSWLEYQGRALLEQSRPADRFPAILSVDTSA